MVKEIKTEDKPTLKSGGYFCLGTLYSLKSEAIKIYNNEKGVKKWI